MDFSISNMSSFVISALPHYKIFRSYIANHFVAAKDGFAGLHSVFGLVEPQLTINGIETNAVMIENDGHFLEMQIKPLKISLRCAHFRTQGLHFGPDSNLSLRQHGDLGPDLG